MPLPSNDTVAQEMQIIFIVLVLVEVTPWLLQDVWRVPVLPRNNGNKPNHSKTTTKKQYPANSTTMAQTMAKYLIQNIC
jgi:hypothetical protein